MTPKFTRTKIKEKELLGEKLAKKRVSLGYEVKDVERTIKIRSKHIGYIENGEWEKLPPDVFVRGFLKSYSRYLKLDPEKVLSLYYKERGMQEQILKASAPPVSEKESRKSKKNKIIITPKKLTVLAIAIVAVSVLTYIGWQVSILAAAPKLELTGPGENTETKESSIVVEGLTDAGSNVYINDIPIGVDPEGTFAEEVSLHDGVNLIKISAENKLDKKTEVTRTVVANLEQTILPNKEDPSGLVMKLDIGPNPTSMYIEIDGKAVSGENSVMLPGSSQTIKAKESIVISASDGGSVNVTLNNEDLGKLGKSGEKIDKKEFNQI